MVRNNQNTFGNKNTLFIKDDKILPVNKLTCSVFFLKKITFFKKNKSTCKCGHDASRVGSSSSGSNSLLSLGGRVLNILQDT